jgi:hypothetical protein
MFISLSPFFATKFIASLLQALSQLRASPFDLNLPHAVLTTSKVIASEVGVRTNKYALATCYRALEYCAWILFSLIQCCSGSNA